MPVQDRTIIVRYGLRMGAACAVCGLIIALTLVVNKTGATLGGGLALGACVAFLAMLGLLVEAGNLAGQRTGSVGTSALVGTISGLLGGFGVTLASPVAEFQDGKLQHVIVGVIVTMVIFSGIFGAFGTVLGGLGGMIGQSKFRRNQSSPPSTTSHANDPS